MNKLDTDETITINQIREKIIEQGYKCKISGLPLVCSTLYKFPFKPSIDRINRNLPHTNNNTQIVCLSINYGKLHHTNKEIIDYIEKLRTP